MITAYITLNDANTYFSSKLNTNAWDDASDLDRQKALYEATRRIDSLKFIGIRTNSLQDLEFPRGTDLLVPQDIQFACCEIALKLLDGVEVDEEIENLTVQSHGYSSVKTAYDRKSIPDHLAAGIPSYEAWCFLSKYLFNPLNLTLRRD